MGDTMNLARVLEEVGVEEKTSRYGEQQSIYSLERAMGYASAKTRAQECVVVIFATAGRIPTNNTWYIHRIFGIDGCTV